ncbi:MAG TPA: hypothetical protein PKD98_26505 [Anaerolineae bacterium]|nr:hypothetical protein [Anaerolineae bacterium]
MNNEQLTNSTLQLSNSPTLQSFSLPLLHSSTLPSFLILVLLISFLLLILTACGSQPLTPEQQIREYIFVHQPVTGPDFVDWANVALADYPSRRVYRAIYSQGQTEADKGHPNAVATLSFAARAWAEEKNLTYNPTDWLAMQQQAIANLRDDPGQINLWPTAVPE